MILTSSTCSVPEGLLCGPAAPAVGAPSTGDLALVEVAAIGHHTAVEDRRGETVPLDVGARLVAAFGPRYAVDGYSAALPTDAPADVDLCAPCGLLGSVDREASHPSLGAPTRVRVLGTIAGPDGRPLSTRSHPSPDVAPCEAAATRVLLFVGSSMGSGKSTAIEACTRAAVAAGADIATGKATGTARLAPLLASREAGARAALDFSSLGLPTTCGLDAADLERLYGTLRDALSRSVPAGLVLMELADGLFQPETDALLRSRGIRESLAGVVFCAGDPVAVRGGLHRLEELDLEVRAVSGRVASSALAIREVASFTSLPVLTASHEGAPAFDALLRPLLRSKA